MINELFKPGEFNKLLELVRQLDAVGGDWDKLPPDVKAYWEAVNKRPVETPANA